MKSNVSTKRVVKQGTRVVHPEFNKGVVMGYGNPTGFAIRWDETDKIGVYERSTFKLLKIV